ncbi:TPA: hypothetical protein RYX77_004373 [Serratia marcescens]|uniref:hypothetical protein n=1 Tax=Serratia ureilytica TaxID=300181 RepID=UPI0029060E16|nr:hypothetical protein [Serratia marcescens]HEB0069556.1 hypothetical protein [Serratia marcescens]HEB0072725.1 hypothetical protein [Serratia marcescens]HEB0093189.1 hypothetical protein [Serratia marcescens]HEB0127165.1 hypothetical protein [Serratia marcescens]
MSIIKCGFGIVAGLIISYGYASPYPIVNSISSTIVDNGGPRYIKYEYTESIIEIGSAGDIVVPDKWPVGIAHKHYESKSSNPIARIEGFGNVSGNGLRTISDLAMEVYRGKQNNAILHSGYLGGDIPECLGYVAAPNRTLTSWSDTLYPAGMCLIVPPPQQWCNIITPKVEIDHGTLSIKEAESSIAEGKVSIQCSTGTKVRVRFINDEPYIKLSPAGIAYISVNGYAIGGVFNLLAGVNVLNLTSKLFGVNNAGRYFGSAIMVIEPA